MHRKIKVKEKINQKDLHTLLKLMEKEINVLIDGCLSQIVIPNDSFNSVTNQTQKDLLKNLGVGEHWQRIPHGFKLITNDLTKHLSEAELNLQKEEFSKAINKIESSQDQKAGSIEELAEKIEETPETFQELFGLSDQMIEYFYQSGCRYYENSHFQDASDVFYTITFLNPGVFNVWLSLGFSEMQLHHYEKALEAFAMATLIDIASVIPHIHSAECYIYLKNYPIAKKTLELALKTLKNNPTELSQKNENYILHMMNKIKNR